mmetsp:Transcript_27434/g.79097  ORF Transcript_27434/g.79097 Transcript_27434/m.79097 type:complete len:248 (+) Transcript_27434:129-872(+)
MVTCRIATQFCCGCSINFGVKFILGLHLMRNVAVVMAVVSNLCFRMGRVDIANSLVLETSMAGFSFAGLPVILLALWAVYHKVEAPIRLYLYYMVIGFVIDMAIIIDVFVINGPCQHIPNVFSRGGLAFACGAARMGHLFAIVTFVSISLYLIFIVLSFCEDLARSGTGPDLSDLSWYKQADDRRKGDPLDHIIQSFQPQLVDEYGSMNYQSGVNGIGGSVPIFGGRHHQMLYPPPLDTMATRYRVA